MNRSFLYDREKLVLSLPDEAIVYESSFPVPGDTSDVMLEEALGKPHGAPAIEEALRKRRQGKVVIVVSDITRPIPYSCFLPRMLDRIESAGVRRDEILLLVATGMHRASTREEHAAMFGESVAANYEIIDHKCDDESELAEVPGKSWSGNSIKLNRHLVGAGFRIATGLVEPHFMAGFSGGRKAICPGCSSLETVSSFHGEPFLADEKATNGNLDGNPLHLEALSVARAVGVDFTLNVVLNNERQVVRIFAGELEKAHEAACGFVASCSCPVVEHESDVVITSSGGYPLDATFYQCVKGFVSCLPAVKPGGRVIAFGGCSEGIGSSEYSSTLREFGGGRWRLFPEHIREPGVFVKDQWQFQMHCRTLARVGEENLAFVTAGIDGEDLKMLSVNPYGVCEDAVQVTVQGLIDEAVARGASVAVFPEGPYAAPVAVHRQ